eukprot:TRINITY_DN174_c0_g1::TRINITY_DN174_c0_g1_i1::g.14369::m.14369 TRINITY_DN174_c0_g1::TRINITY_DN174_c0_g1_i1::g.14369  ORF type:complete len:565 (-),score=176.29,sp/Q9M1H3/AB4F_ARATH/44.64/7e-156,ABC_tran/PF00005.22/8.4e-22,ABC_tran/PF00005.22/2.5e+03,ABC_tran/PF00005.22/4.4e-21,AAA_21/PF13304.1/1.4e-05,AAA_21/PF13304.1/1.2e+03,AAA_21/PF13304.1/0.0057,AAA_21/PF13304.1/9.5e-05,SMC_N/PF02463.14/0.00097,SMC_N/PF02463.14/2.4e+03,SMC_N/PF02463.14/2.6,SMC_N/PF02463.14/0.18,AAA_29/PF13555.1/0.036,AAA_29/P
MAEGSNDIVVRKFNIYAGGKPLFKEANVTFAFGRRYGLVGENGSGKTTLMHTLANQQDDFEGVIPSHIDILLVQQEARADETPTIQAVVEADVERLKLLAEQKDLTEKLESPDHTDEEKEAFSERLRAVYERLHYIKADSAEQRASAILSGLQFTEEQKYWPTKSFSGGWRMRISLARALFRRPRLLLLDEPTNHLDLHAVLWLEDYLQRWTNTLVVVSHDKDFMNNVCTDILHIWQTKLYHYIGDFDNFEKVYTQKVEEYKKEYEKQEKRLKEMKKQGKVTTNVSKTSSRESKTKKEERKAVTATRKGKNLLGEEDEDGQPALLEPLKENKITIEVQTAEKLVGPLIKVEGVDFGYPDKELLFKDLDFGIHMDSRIALVGANGTGKSTLIKLMKGELTPLCGLISHHPKLRIGYFSQHSVDQLMMDKTPVEYIQELFPEMNYQMIRNRLGKFGLPGNAAIQRIDTLSGGQKSRVVFVELSLKRCHIMLLDEPTNHLDLETIDALIDAMKEFEGGVVIVTHNVRLISDICSEIWICKDDRTLEFFEGDFHDYRQSLIDHFDVNV